MSPQTLHAPFHDIPRLVSRRYDHLLAGSLVVLTTAPSCRLILVIVRGHDHCHVSHTDTRAPMVMHDRSSP